jgi:hypothetical protein
VIDSKQLQSVANASISVRYLRTEKPVLNPPAIVEVTTDANGQAELKVADYNLVFWNVTADGYTPMIRAVGHHDKRRIPDLFERKEDGEVFIRLRDPHSQNNEKPLPKSAFRL